MILRFDSFVIYVGVTSCRCSLEHRVQMNLSVSVSVKANLCQNPTSVKHVGRIAHVAIGILFRR